ncbi:hypothetical protein ACIBCN_41345 [Nocardia sp. NPDC051052]|uniref:hypothetical protein n=1 Tax=Nocardia sp. NPDC051052 TaxID=3364322 RepID=UPI0037B14451
MFSVDIIEKLENRMNIPYFLSNLTAAPETVDQPPIAGNDMFAEKSVSVAGFFPGLGSRTFYQNLGWSLLDSGIASVTGIYQEAARVLGFPNRPHLLLMAPENLPEGRMERQGFIGAVLLVHSLALDAYLRIQIEKNESPLRFVTYTGESFGILAAAVASGSLSVSDGVQIARAFTPLMLLAAEGDRSDEPFARDMATYLPEAIRHTPLVPEPSHVTAVQARSPEELAVVLGSLGETYPITDVELHKTYSPTQANVYVRAGIKSDFDMYMTAFPDVTTRRLKDPTVFLAHSARMWPARHALDQFMDANEIRFDDPRIPVVSNHDVSLLTGAADIRRAVLAMTDQVMASRDTCEMLGTLDIDIVLELGLGKKSVQLLHDNNIAPSVAAYTGSWLDTDRLLRAVDGVHSLTTQLAELHTIADRLEKKHYDILRDLFRLAASSEFCDDYLARTLGRVIITQMLPSDRAGAPAFYRFLEVFQHTRKYRRHISAERGELITKARLKKRITGGDPALLGKAYLELEVIDDDGYTEVRAVDSAHPEVIVVHFDSLPDLDGKDLASRIQLLLDAQPTALRAYHEVLFLLEGEYLDDDDVFDAGSRIAYQYLLFHALDEHRPALFAQSDFYLEGSDPLGWLAALAVSGAISLHDAIILSAAQVRAESCEPMMSGIVEAEIPLVSPEGVLIQSEKDLVHATQVVLRRSAPSIDVRRIRLNGNRQIITFGSNLADADIDEGPYETDIVAISEPAEVWKTRLNLALDEFEYACVLALTDEHIRVCESARSRRILPSTVYAYIDIDESIVGFGRGGSESMTIFVRKARGDNVVVRKILSETLTTAPWDPDGTGVMLPPFEKAKKQAEFLQALPDSVRSYFPEVYSILERELPLPPHLHRDGRAFGREVIYEMEYIAGEEVSRFVEKQAPPPAVVARLYEQIISVLHRDVHSVGRVPAPGETLEVSYFKKIEDRLNLCRRTAPQTFNAYLLDTERIIINNMSYLNSSALLRRFRESSVFLKILEPAFHSLVMGDTNTENIKIVDTAPLLHAQRAIESEASQLDIDTALAAIASVKIKFLDPRAIGFKTEGMDTRDDAMYDNKPWHNSIGHYDEIHFEQFTINVTAGVGKTPDIDISFLAGNPYQKAYRVRDVVATGGFVDTKAPIGIEDYFAPVMTAALGLDDPESAFLRDDPYWLIRFVFMMGQHFTAMPPFHFQKELDGTLMDEYQTQRRPVAIYCEGIKWLNWALQMLEGTRTEFLGIEVPSLNHLSR